MEFQGRESQRRPLTPLPLGAWPYSGTADVGAHSPEVPIWEAWDLPMAGPTKAARPVAVRVRQLLDGHRKEHISNRSFTIKIRTGDAAIPAPAISSATNASRLASFSIILG